MEFLRQIGQLTRLHYEKIILSLVLLGLAIGVWSVYQASLSEADKIQNFFTDVDRRQVKPVEPADLSRSQAVLKQLQSLPTLNFSSPHHLFNPVKWQRKPDGTLLKIQTGTEVGWPQMVISRLTPLTFTISLEKPAGTGYWMGVTDEAAERPLDRRKKQMFATLNVTNKVFILREVKGAPEDPSELTVELVESGERVRVAKDKPYSRVEGYEADLQYKIDGKTFSNLRVGSPFRFLADDYIIVAINENEVVASARANDKKFSVRQMAQR